MRKGIILALILWVFATPANATNYSVKSHELTATYEAPFQNYVVRTVTQDDSAYAEVMPSHSFHGNVIRIVNTSNYDAYVKINNKSAFTVFASTSFTIGYDNITSIMFKSKTEEQSVTLEVSIWGRNDLAI